MDVLRRSKQVLRGDTAARFILPGLVAICCNRANRVPCSDCLGGNQLGGSETATTVGLLGGRFDQHHRALRSSSQLQRHDICDRMVGVLVVDVVCASSQ